MSFKQLKDYLFYMGFSHYFKLVKVFMLRAKEKAVKANQPPFAAGPDTNFSFKLIKEN